MLTIPNILTFLRISLIPAFVLFFYIPFPYHHVILVSIYVLAGFTDWLDGYLARNLNQSTKLGAFLDPVADKLMVAIALVLIVGDMGSALIALPAAVIVGREIVISALREWMAELGKRTSLAVSFVAKVKTTIQMLAILLLLLYQSQTPSFTETAIKIIGIILLYIAALLTLWSMVMYIKVALPDLTLSKEDR